MIIRISDLIFIITKALRKAQAVILSDSAGKTDEDTRGANVERRAEGDFLVF